MPHNWNSPGLPDTSDDAQEALGFFAKEPT
jgi:hypothetical protein